MTEQQRYQVRFDWGVAGAAAVGDDADVIVWLDALDPVPAPLPALPPGSAVIETGFAGAVAAAEWILALQETLQRRTMVALVAAGAPRGDGIRFAAEDLLAAGALVDAMESRGIDAASPEAAAADAAFRTLRRAVGSLTAAVVGATEDAQRPEGFTVARPHPDLVAPEAPGLADLEARLSGRLLGEPDALVPYRTDRSGWATPEVPLAAVLAESVSDVQETLRFASAHRIPVVPRGAGTGLAGGAVGTAGSIVLDVSRLNRVLEIDVANETAVVEPGVITDELAAALAPYDLWWPPDPASRAISSVGGNIATNAGGLLCAKYGVTRESVLGLAVVLADGRLVRLGRRTVKGVTGYDLTALMIGSEGTLGVVVEATLKLRRRSTDPVVTLGATFPTVEQAASAAAAITATGLRPAALELLDAASCAAIDALLGGADGVPSLAGHGAFLLVQTDGPAADREAALAAELIAAEGGVAHPAEDEAAGERLLAVRRAAHPAFARLGEVLIEDVSVPRTAMPAMFAAIERISAEHGLPIPTVAHAGDGNLHPNVVIPPGLPHAPGEIPDAVWRAADAVFTVAMELGGTLTGEHGVGVLKRRWLERELGADVLGLSARVKRAFDPLGILNPGKAV